MMARERKRVALRDLPDDMDDVKASIQRLIDHTGLPSEEEPVAEEIGDKEMVDDDGQDELDA